jgi:putative endopeptidase
MHRRLGLATVLALVAACSSPERHDHAVTGHGDPAASPSTAPAASPPPAGRPASLASAFDPENADPAVRPQDDLFRAVNGGWLARAEIPPDRPQYGTFAVLQDEAEANVRALIEGTEPGPDPAEAEKVRAFYASFLDQARVDSLGLAPISSMLAAVQGIDSKVALAERLAALRRIGVQGAFRISVGSDAKDSDRTILHVGQDGLGLPDRDYYEKPRFREKLEAYGPHVERVLALAGFPDAASAAAAIVALEKEIAEAHWTKEASRNDTKTYNKMTRAELASLAPGFAWDVFLDVVGAKDERELVVAQPSYLTAFAKLVDERPLETWKAWLAWRVIHHHADLLGQDLADEEFAFYGKKLSGVVEQRPRWKRAVAAVQSHMGEAVGKLYVARFYPPEAEERMTALVQNLIAAYRERFEKNEWMSPETRAKALAKLAAFTPKIGHPRKWRDYSTLEIKSDDLVGNARRASAFEWNRNLGKLGKPVDRDEWHMTPQTVNAYYSSERNEIVFPAAILQPPFFDLRADDAVNYGGIGAVIGHEIGHGFDDQGSKWDGAGNLNDWWTPADRSEFDKRASALAAQFDVFEPLPGFKVNGRLTLGENMGDLAGLTVSHAAYHMSLHGAEAPSKDGLTGDQRFFMSFARIWRGKNRDEETKRRLATDPHSPPEFRANGTVRNVPAFYEAFGVKEGDKMFLPPEERVRIW